MQVWVVLNRNFSNEQRLKGLQDLASLEMQIQEEAFTNKFNRIQEQDELLAEQQRINATETLRIAKETADEQAKIQKKLIDDNLQAIATGNAHQIQLEKLSSAQQKDLAIKTGRELVSQLAQSNKTAFKVDKALKMAQAIMNTATGVTKALSVGNIPLAVLIGALGAVQVASIAQTKYQGRRLGGRMNQGEPYMVGEAGAELVIPDRPSNVVPNNKLGGMSQPVTVNFNINTVDARGFNELLVNSRGTIVNMINSAMNEKGRNGDSMSGSLPNVRFNAINLKSNQNTLFSQTDSGKSFRRQIDAQRFSFTVQYPPMTRAEFAPIMAFIMKQKGQEKKLLL